MSVYIDRHRGDGNTVRIAYTDHKGVRRTFTPQKGTTLAKAKKVFAELQGRENMIRKGILAEPKIANTMPFSEAYEAWLSNGRANGGRRGYPWSPDHLKMVMQRMKFWINRLKPVMLADLENCVPKVERIMAELKLEGKSGGTINEYTLTLKSFLNWCCIKRDYLEINPLLKVARYAEEPTFRRRALTHEEIHKILGGCYPERRLLYSIALTTALRAGTLKKLEVRNFNPFNCSLMVPAKIIKNRKDKVCFMPKLLAAELTGSIAGKNPEEPLLIMSPLPNVSTTSHSGIALCSLVREVARPKF